MRLPPLLLIALVAVLLVIIAMLLRVSTIQDYLMERSTEMGTSSSTEYLFADDPLRLVGPVGAAEATIETRRLN